MSKVEKIACQGINFVVRDSSNSYEDQSNGFSIHAPFILSADEASVKSLRNDIKSEIDHGKEWDILREDKGFITSENRFVDPQYAMRIAVDTKVISDLYFKKEILELMLKREHEPKNENIRTVNGLPLTIDYDDIRKDLEEINARIEKGLLPEDLY